MAMLKNKWVWLVAALVVAAAVEYKTKWFSVQYNKLMNKEAV